MYFDIARNSAEMSHINHRPNITNSDMRNTDTYPPQQIYNWAKVFGDPKVLFTILIHVDFFSRKARL
jgi:hypothetical protein